MGRPTIQRRLTHSTAMEPRTELMQARMALYARVGVPLVCAYFLLVNIFPPTGRDFTHPYRIAANAVMMGMIVTMSLAWLLTRGAPRNLAFLKRLDATVLWIFCALVGVYGWLNLSMPGYGFVVLLVTTNLLCYRAALIPSTPRRTTMLGLVASLPAAFLALVPILMPNVEVSGGSMVGFTLAWCTVGVGISTVVSGVIFDLRRRAIVAERLGQYELVKPIGEGAMGAVYRARHAMLRRPTAVKLLHPHIAGPDNIERFEREVQHSAALTHPNTIAIYDYGRTPDGLFYYAMEFLDGEDLHQLVSREGAQSPARVVHILRQICGSLAEAHGLGLVHRDIKAANVYLCQHGGNDDVVKVLDFGLVRSVDDAKEQHLSGTPTYMAPEVIENPGLVSKRADIYAVGVLGYLLLAGQLPIDGPSVPVVLSRQIGEDPEPPSSLVGHPLPLDLEAVIMHCLEKEPDVRPQTVLELDAGLAACQARLG